MKEIMTRTVTVIVFVGMILTLNSLLMKETDESKYAVRSDDCLPDDVPEKVYTRNDPANLNASDAKGDDYTFYFEGKDEDSTVVSSSGVKGKFPCVDIIEINAEMKGESLTVTVKHAGDIMYGMSMDYYVFFVESAHQQSGSLLNPQDHKDGSFSYSYSDTSNSIAYIKLDDDMFEGTYAWSNPEMPSLTWSASGGTLTFTVSTSDLEDAGVTLDSDFGIYAYSARTASMPGETWYNQITWDSAGLGAAAAPEVFNEKLWESKFGNDDESGNMLFLLVIIGIVVIIAIVVIVFLVVRQKRKKSLIEQTPQPQKEGTSPAPVPGGSGSPPIIKEGAPSHQGARICPKCGGNISSEDDDCFFCSDNWVDN